MILAAQPIIAKPAWPFRISYPSAHPASDTDIAAIALVVSHRREGSRRIVWIRFFSSVKSDVFMKEGELLTLRKRQDRWFIDPWAVGTWAP
jgi:hypothetical protein